VAVTLAVSFERLSQVLEEASLLPRAEAYHLLRDAVDTIEPETELRLWFLRRAAVILVPEDDGA